MVQITGRDEHLRQHFITELHTVYGGLDGTARHDLTYSRTQRTWSVARHRAQPLIEWAAGIEAFKRGDVAVQWPPSMTVAARVYTEWLRPA